jgi:HEPN domain-containing protein
MSKPTVVQYLLEVLRVNAGIRVSKQFQEEVLQMEKQMIIDAYLAGYSATENQGDPEQYYNENYKKEEK